MENNKLPPLQRENSLPEDFPDIPEKMDPLGNLPVTEESPEELPVIEELAFEPEDTAGELTEETSHQETVPEELPMEAPSEQHDAAPEVAATITEEVLDHVDVVIPMMDQTETLPDVPEQIEKAPEWEEIASELPETEETEDYDYRDNGQDFDTMMKAPAPEPENVQSAPTSFASKGRPKRKKGEGLLGIPSILVTFVWLALILVIGVTAGRMLWICAADVLAFGREDKVVTVTVYEADTMEDIIDKLHEGGLIRYKSLFSLYADISDAQEDIKPGIYDLNTRYDYHALVNFMSPRSSREVIKVTIPEGYTCRQIFSLLEENRICTALDAAAYAASGELPEYWFLEGVERGTENCLEGYLFPDTYEFYKNSTPREAIERMLDNFEYRFNEEMIAQLDSVNSKFHADYGVREIVIIASLIEKESAAPGESPMVSGVIYNRLFKWGNNRPLLNIDASIVYAQEGQNERIDTKLDHPYNTYLYEGLTPGPIANPGLASLKAALNPETHNYYYYVLNPSTGMHQFSTTYEEHQGYVREFNTAPEIEIE